DAYRHPGQTLALFGITPTLTVIEITPGGGWYSEILAPYLRERGQYIAAVVDPAAVPEGRGRDDQQKARATLEQKFAAAPAQ
ncbi:methyltransferase, partial [Xanthomonas hyacinthi DSM 19077]